MRRFVLGLDGCPGGWVGVRLDLDGSAPPQARVYSRFADAVGDLDRPLAIAVDMPIGFRDTATPGGRECEQLARRRLGPRRSSVFSAPSRPALSHAGDYHSAGAANRGDTGVGLSLQSFHLIPKMREIDAAMTPQLQARVRESHPELAFTQLNGGVPMRYSKKNAHGRAERRAVLERVGAIYGLTRAFLDLRAHEHLRGAGVARDDLIDAAVVALVAARIARGDAETLPPDPPRDSKGLRMEIVV